MEMYSDLENNIWQENGGNSICYGIPELAKPLLKQPTEVLKLKNVVGLCSLVYLFSILQINLELVNLIIIFSCEISSILRVCYCCLSQKLKKFLKIYGWSVQGPDKTVFHLNKACLVPFFIIYYFF